MMSPTERLWALSTLHGAAVAAAGALSHGDIVGVLSRLSPGDWDALCTGLGVGVGPRELVKGISRLAANADSLLGELMDADRVSELAMAVLDPAALRSLADTLEAQRFVGGAR
jgi:hypothetical protein